MIYTKDGYTKDGYTKDGYTKDGVKPSLKVKLCRQIRNNWERRKTLKNIIFYYTIFTMAIDYDTNLVDDDDLLTNTKEKEKEMTTTTTTTTSDDKGTVDVNEFEKVAEDFLLKNQKVSFGEFRDMQTYFINLVLFVAEKQETKEDKHFFVLFAFYMYVNYLLFFYETFEEEKEEESEYLQLGGVKEWIIRNGETMKVEEDDIQKGDIPLSAASGFREGNRVIQYGNDSLAETRQGDVVVPEQMFRDPVSTRLNNKQQELLQQLQMQEQVMETENRIRDLQRMRDLSDITYDERRRVLEGKIPTNEIITSAGLSIAMGIVCCICMEVSRNIVQNQVQNITTGVTSVVTGTVSAVASAATSENVPKGAIALGNLFYNVGSYTSKNVAYGADYLSSFFVNPEVVQSVTDKATQTQGQAQAQDTSAFILPQDTSIYETVWSQCMETMRDSTSRTSFQCGLAIAACSLCCMYRQSVIRANDTKRKLVLGSKMYDDERKQNQRNFNHAAKIVAAGLVGGPLAAAATSYASRSRQEPQEEQQEQEQQEQPQQVYEQQEEEILTSPSLLETTGMRQRKPFPFEKGGKITKKRQAKRNKKTKKPRKQTKNIKKSKKAKKSNKKKTTRK